MAVDAGKFREIFGSLPTAVAVVTAVGEDGEPCGLTMNTVTAVAKTPPLLLVCLDETSQTLRAIRHSGTFVVNFLAGHGSELSDRFARKGRGKFAGFDWLAAPSAGGAPILSGHVLAHAECSVREEIRVGDHSVVIGLLDDGEAYDRPPLVYYRKNYSAWPIGGLRAIPTGR
ncbi:flavin reductase family protein [Amycolatopsis circi]|uniref:flavin reductase family protein n=1 Tax=Amycolatopsis circi TaxID=871959 RepID=UPI000E250F46|nr:flavin reductase family protein [Amycolatopsis circi]